MTSSECQKEEEKTMMRKICAMLLSACMLICFASCDGTATEVNIDNNINNNIDSNIENGVNNENQQGDSDVDVEFNESHNHGESSTKENTPNVVEPTKKQETPTKQPTQPAATSPSHIHNYSNATCTQPRYCSCGATIGSALGHQFSSATCTSPKVCSRCGETSGSALGHNYSSATCTSAKKCSRCGATSGSALGHNYVNNKCSRCGKIDPNSLPVGLHELHVIDYSYQYKYYNSALKDTFGNTYVGYHKFIEEANEAYAIYNLDNKYSRFTCDIVIDNEIYNDRDVTVSIYVDNRLMFQKSGISKTSGKIHVDINVRGGQQLKIVTTDNNYSWSETVCLVNAQLTK